MHTTMNLELDDVMVRLCLIECGAFTGDLRRTLVFADGYQESIIYVKSG